MDEETNGPLPPPKEEQEKMEVTVTTQLENVIMTPDSVDLPSSSEGRPEEAGGVGTAPTAPTLPSSTTQEEPHDSDSDSSSSSSSAPVSVDGDDESFSQPVPIKARDEVLLEELPAVKELCLTLPEEAELAPVGTVSSIIQQLVIVQSLKDTPPLTDDSIIFTSDRQALAQVFDVFGPVSSPLYILRFNSADQITNKGLKEGLTVYYAPAIKEYTGYIFIQQLKHFKGSDASWKNDQEPPMEALDYSDDEKEKEAKRKLKHSKKKDNNNTDNPAHITQNTLQQRDTRVFSPRNARAPFRHQNPRSNHQSFPNTHDPPTHPHPPRPHANVPPMYPPPPCPYPPPPFPPANYPLYPPPSFFNPLFSSPHWPPYSVPFSNPPPPPPPPPPQ